MMLTLKNQNIKLTINLLAIAYSLQLIFGMFSSTYAATLGKADSEAQTIYYENRPPNAKGDFSFEFQTTNGITTKAAGNEHGHSGVIQYISSEGIPVTMTYIADADGYHPTGDFIPVIPTHVLKSLEYIKTHPIVDEKKSRHF